MRDAVLRFAILTAADLSHSDLSRADLAHAKLNKATFKAADLRESCFDHARLDGADLSRLSIQGASLRFASLSFANLEAADLSGANLAHARLDRANLRDAILTNARLDYADFAGANLANVNLAGADLQNAKNLTPSQLEESIGDATTILPAHLEGVVSWSRAYGKPTPPTLVYRDASAAPRGTTERSAHSAIRHGTWIAVLLLLTALAGAGWWRYTTDTSPFENTVADPVAQAQQTSAERISPPSIRKAATASELIARPTRHVRTINQARDALLAPRDTLQAQPPIAQSVTAGKLPSVAETITAQSEAPAMTLIPQQSTGENGIRPLHAEREVSALAAPFAWSPPHLAMNAPEGYATLRPLSAARIPSLVAISANPPLAPPSGASRSPAVLASFSPQAKTALTALPPSFEIFATKVSVARWATETQPQELMRAAYTDPVTLSVSLSKQVIDVYRGTVLIESSRVSSGMTGHETKTGVFSILEKQRLHHSNLYSDAPMPWMQRLTRSGTALHAGVVPGYPASHGCVRLPFSFASRLYRMTAVGQNVLIANEQLTPKLIEHPNLFTLPTRQVPIAMASREPDPARLTDAIEESPTDTAILPLVIAKEVDTANTAGTQALPDAGSDLATPPLRILVTRRDARDRLIGVQYALSSLGYLKRQNFDGTLGNATAAAFRKFRAANGLPAVRGLTGDLVQKVYQVVGQPVPPEGHIFVRRGFARVFDMPITFHRSSEPLGTHIYTVVGYEGDDAKARWIAFSLEGGDATDALDRLEIPDEARRRISGLLTPGSSLIVADKSFDSAILPEGDDFIVGTSDDPAELAASIRKQAGVEPTPIARPKPKRAARPPAKATRPTIAPEYTADRQPRPVRRRWFSRF